MVRIEEITEPITIKIDRSSAEHVHADEVEAAWQALCAQNPRYFNGKMLAFNSYDPATGVIHAHAEEYKYHAVRDVVNTETSLLSVTAVLAAPDYVRDTGVYLLGKRSPELHRYGGLWEFGPCGGIDLPRIGNTLKPKHIASEIAREILEEIGVKISNQPSAPRALVHDDAVGSTDIAIPIVLDHVPAINTNWEYTQTRWMTLDELFGWTQSKPHELIPTTVELTRFLHENRS